MKLLLQQAYSAGTRGVNRSVIEWTPQRVRSASNEEIRQLALASGYSGRRLKKYRTALIRALEAGHDIEFAAHQATFRCVETPWWRPLR